MIFNRLQQNKLLKFLQTVGLNINLMLTMGERLPWMISKEIWRSIYD